MKSDHDIIRSHLTRDMILDPLPTQASLDYVRQHQAEVERFEALRRNRMMCGWYRHRHNFSQPGPGSYAAAREAMYRLERYLETGNQEHLADAANLCMVEFVLPSHPNAHFTATDDGHHTEALR